MSEEMTNSQGGAVIAAPAPVGVAPVAPAPVTPVIPPLPSEPTLSAQMDAEVKPAKDSSLQASFFDDDAPVEGKKLYSLALDFHGHKVYANPLKRGVYKHFMAAAKADEAAIKELSAREVTPDTAEAIDEAIEAALLRQSATNTQILLQSIVDWELPNSDGTRRPCTPDTIARLRASHKSELAQLVVMASVVSRAESDL